MAAHRCSSLDEYGCPLSWYDNSDVGCDCSRCTPLGPLMDYTYLRKIEKHVSSRNSPHHPSIMKNLVFKGDIEGTTPLLLACEQGDLDTVKHIVERWRVDVRAAAPFHLRSNEVGQGVILSVEATPLFVAALCGCYDVVHYLLKKGAQVNVKTVDLSIASSYGNRTPLDGAFLTLDKFLGEHMHQSFISIICLLLQSGSDLPSQALPGDKPVWLIPCHFKILKELVNHGMDVSSCRYNGTTVLHHWASMSDSKNDPLAAVDFLLKKGADITARDEHGYTPILVAAGVEPFNSRVFDSLIERGNMDRLEQIEALELAGAVILSGCSRDVSPNKAFRYWRRALNLRMLDNNENKPIIKIPLERKSGHSGEWVTPDQLDNVIRNPSEHKIQALLVRLRIGSTHRAGMDVFHSSFNDLIQRHLNEWYFVRKDQAEKYLDASFAVFETIAQDSTLPWNSWYPLVHLARNLVYTLLAFQKNSELLSIEIMKASLDFMVETDKNHSTDEHGLTICSDKKTLLDLVKFFASLPQILKDDAIVKSLTHLLRQVGHDEEPLLHLALLDPDKKNDLAAIIHLLLQCKVDPNAVDEKRKGPLHYFAESKTSDSQLLATVHLLVESRADNMARDYQGFTPIRVAAENDPFNFSIFDFFVEREETDRVEKIEALELAGAVILTSSSSTSSDARNKALDYWRRALQLQLLDTTESPPVIKIPVKRKCGNKCEWITSADLENVIQQPSEHKKQAFLVRLRIASTKRDDTGAFLPSFSSFIDRYLTDLQDNRKFDEFLDAVFAVFETISHFPKPPWNSWYLLVGVAEKLVSTLSIIQETSPELFKAGIKTSLDLMVETERHLLVDLNLMESYMKMLLDLIGKMAGLPQMFKNDAILESLKQLLGEDRRDKKSRTLLHFALINADKKNSDLLTAIIELLLQSNVDPNAVDENRAAPLHYLAYYGNVDQFSTIGDLLSKHGADIDQVNLSRKTAMDIWGEKFVRKRLLNANDARAPEWNELPDWSHQVPKLRCLCAKRIRSRVHSSQISSLEIPVTLRPFLKKH